MTIKIFRCTHGWQFSNSLGCPQGPFFLLTILFSNGRKTSRLLYFRYLSCKETDLLLLGTTSSLCLTTSVPSGTWAIQLPFKDISITIFLAKFYWTHLSSAAKCNLVLMSKKDGGQKGENITRLKTRIGQQE